MSKKILIAELERLRKAFHHGSDVSLAIVHIEETLWTTHGENAVTVNAYGDEEDAQIILLAEKHIILNDFRDWTGGFSPKEAEDRIEEYIEINWQDWSDEAKAWLRKAQV
jgi:hypothetical protein